MKQCDMNQVNSAIGELQGSPFPVTPENVATTIAKKKVNYFPVLRWIDNVPYIDEAGTMPMSTDIVIMNEAYQKIHSYYSQLAEYMLELPKDTVV